MSTPKGKPLRVGVVGCGGIAQIVHIPILARLKAARLTALCDVDVQKAAILANRFDVPSVYGDIEEMIEGSQLDAVFILTPNSLHLPMTLLALANGLHVFVERPAGRNAEEASKIAAAARSAERNVMVGMHSRFRPDLRHLHTYIQEQRFGKVFFVKAEWLQAKFEAVREEWLLSSSIAGGGVLMDLGLQLVDTTWWLVGRPPLQSVKAHQTRVDPQLSVEDFCSFYLRFANDVKLSAHVSWNFPIARDRFFAEVFGANGSCTLNPFRIEKIWQGKSLNITPQTHTSGRILFRMAYEAEIRHFVQFLTGNAAVLESTIDEAVEVMGIIDAIYRSLHTNREIRAESGGA